MSTKSILLVEDDINLRQSIALILQRAGYIVTATSQVTKTMNILKSGQYELMITDSNIPEVQQVMLSDIHDVYPNLATVILTDQSVAEKEGKPIRTLYLIKPISPERLLDCVGAIMGDKRAINRSPHNTATVHQQ